MADTDNTEPTPNPTPAVAVEPVTGMSLSNREKQRQRLLNDPRFQKNMGRFKKGAPTGQGRPKSLPRFRKACREDSFMVLQEIRRRIAADTGGDIPLGELVRAFTEISDRGGFLKAKDEQELENAKARLILAAMAIEGLTDEQRKRLLSVVEVGE